ncbi:carbohydrate ABC transporter permease [Alicyclobacillaceae bacterium I2511]|nr:carbohydrate ABC transporter permease [Alicyclobacillaceae bacterium I2511]
MLCLIPVYWMVRSSLTTNAGIFDIHFQPWIVQFHWRNFGAAWSSQPFALFFVNSIASNFILVICQLVTSALAAYALVFVPFRGKQVLFFLVLLAMMIPLQATFIPIYSMLSDVHLINTYGALILPFAGSAFGIFLLRQGFSSIPKEMVRAARIDGASEYRILWSMVLPNAKPALMTLFLLNFVYHYNSLFWPLVATNSTNMRVIPVALAYFLSQDAGQGLQWNLMMAADLFSVIPVVLLFLFGQRYFVQGIMSTSLKG